MARIKRHRNTRGQRRTKEHRNLNNPELVYKFLGEETAEGARGGSTDHDPAAKCHRCHKRLPNDLVNSASMRSTGKGTGYRPRKDTGRVSKSRCIKRRAISRDPPISYLQKCVGAEGTRKARRYIKKALHFGVESGYLIPSDPTYKILRVSSDLMKSDSQKNKGSDKAHSKERETPNKLEDMQEQRRRRRRRRRRSRSLPSRSPSRRRRRGRRRVRKRRRRSRSRSRGGRYSSPQNPEEAAEDEADNYEMDDPKSNIHTSDREPKSTRSKQPDSESKKTEENDSDLSVDEDESDDEEGKKRMDTTES